MGLLSLMHHLDTPLADQQDAHEYFLRLLEEVS